MSDKMHEPIGGPSWPEERARYGQYEPGSTAPREVPLCLAERKPWSACFLVAGHEGDHVWSYSVVV